MFALPCTAPIAVRPTDYVLDFYDNALAPTLTADSQLKLDIRKHVLRLLLKDIAQEEISLHPPGNADDIANLTYRCLQRAGLV